MIDLEKEDILDITTEDVDFEEMEKDIEKFASDPSVKAVLEVGVDLNNYSSQISAELKKAEEESIEDYLKQVPRVEELRKEIDRCDQALETMENLLVQFKDSLSGISNDICSLQEKSQSITVKLNNRRELEKPLSEFAKNLVVKQDFSDIVQYGDVNTDYVREIDSLTQKLDFIKRPDVITTRAAVEVKPVLEMLKMKACENIKKWMNKLISELKENPENKLSIQNSTLRFQTLFHFAALHSTDLSESMKTMYSDSISSLYLDDIKRAQKSVTKQMAQIAFSDESIIPKQQRSFFRSKRSTGESTLFFSLGERIKIITEEYTPFQISPDGSYPVEFLIKNMYTEFLDAVTSEHYFTSAFFESEALSTNVFHQSFLSLEQFISDLSGRINDPVCMCLLMRICNDHKKELHKRMIGAADKHLDNIMELYLDRFRQIIQNNLYMIEAANPKQFLENENTAYHANAMTRRFSEFAASITRILDEELSATILPEVHSVSAAVIELLERTSKDCKTDELSIVFLVNNYDLVLSTLSTLENSDILSELFASKLQDCTNNYVDTVIQSSFPQLVRTVRDAFPKLETRDEPRHLDITEKELKEIALDFKDKHVPKMKEISDSLIMKFDNFVNGREIVQMIAKKLVLIWAKFDQLCKSMFRGSSSLASSLISPQQLVCNIRPMTENF